MSKSNKPTKKQKLRWAQILEHGCVICGRQAEPHHCKIVAGCRKDHDKVIPLCPAHHRTGGYGIAIHSGKAAWEERYGTEDSCLFTVRTL